jgi:DnaK suppressor protein
MSTQSMTTAPSESSRRKAALESKLLELLSTLGERDELQIEYLADRIDRISSGTDREIAVRRLDTLTRLIHDVQSALLRIEEGSYGFCEQCESQIQRKRLDAVPWARLCISCQSHAEVATRDGKLALRHAA